MSYVLEGFRLLARNRRLWRYIARPMALAGLVFFAFVILGYVLLVPTIAVLLERVHVDPRLSGSLLTVGYIVLWIFLSGVVYLGIAGFCSAMLWERLSIEVEREVGGSGPHTTLPQSVLMLDGFTRFITLMFVVSVAFCCGPFMWGLPGPILGGLLGVFDFTAPYMLRRGKTFGQQRAYVFKLKGWLGFAAVGAVITLLPVVNVLMLPVMVAGGTIMCHRNREIGRLAL